MFFGLLPLCFIQLPLCFVHSCYIFLFARVFLNWSALDLSGPPYNRSVIDITEQHSPFSKVREQHISKSGVYFQKSRPGYSKKESTDLILRSLIFWPKSQQLANITDMLRVIASMLTSCHSYQPLVDFCLFVCLFVLFSLGCAWHMLSLGFVMFRWSFVRLQFSSTQMKICWQVFACLQSSFNGDQIVWWIRLAGISGY